MRNNIFYPYFENFMPLEKPPTLYSILNAAVNYGKPENERVKIDDLAKASRSIVFDFSYDLSDYVDRETFEIMFIEHFLQRRIGCETFTAQRLQIRARLREILPKYNILFDALGEKFNIYEGDGYTKKIDEKEKTHNDTSGESSGTSDRRYSDTPQNAIDNVQSGLYMSDYTYSQDGAETTAETDGSRERDYTEVHTGRVAKLDALLKFNEAAVDTYKAIFRECDDLFYQLF